MCYLTYLVTHLRTKHGGGKGLPPLQSLLKPLQVRKHAERVVQGRKTGRTLRQVDMAAVLARTAVSRWGGCIPGLIAKNKSEGLRPQPPKITNKSAGGIHCFHGHLRTGGLRPPE